MLINTSSVSSFLRLPNEGEIIWDDETSTSWVSFGFLSFSEVESATLFNSTRSWRFCPNTKPLANEISSGFWVLLLLITAPNTAGGDRGVSFLFCVSSTSVSFWSEEFNNFAIKEPYH